MFKRLLFGNEEKLQFKTSATDGIARLYNQASIPASDVRYWRSYLQLFDSASDVFTLLSVADVRRALIKHPENVATLVQILVLHLERLQNDPDFSPLPSGNQDVGIPSAAASAGASLGRLSMQASSSAFNLVNDGARKAAAFGTYLGGGTNNRGASSSSSASLSETPRDRVREALNCSRILTRILPILMEGDHDLTCNVQADGTQQQGASLDSDDFENDLLWKAMASEDEEKYEMYAASQGSVSHVIPPDLSVAQENQFVIEEEDEDEDAVEVDPLHRPNPSQATAAPSRTTTKECITLGERLVQSVVRLLFYSGFTVPWSDEDRDKSSYQTVSESRTHYMIWEKGIGSSSEVKGKSKSHESNRLELLRLLLVLLSKSVFVKPNEQQSTDNNALRILSQSLGKATVLPLLCSLLNVSVVQVKGASWLSSLTSLPVGLVNDKISGTEDVRQATITVALQILNVTLSYEGVAHSEGGELTAANGTMTPSLSAYSVPGTPRVTRPQLAAELSSLSIASNRSGSGKAGQQNLFRFYISKLHRQSDFRLLADGILAILEQRPNAATILNNTTANAQMTDTSAAGPHIPEAMLLFWRLLWHNPKFRTFTLDEHAPQVLSNLLFHALNNKDSPARQGLVRLAIFILHDISCDRAFAVNICKAGSGAKARITGGQRWGVAVGGGSGNNAVSTGNPASGQSSQASTGADIVIQAVYALIATTKTALSALYAPLVITLTNVSPYFKNLSIFSANRLLALFSSFSNASFLLADEGNPRVLYYLIETLNSVVQHGFQRNANVIYAIVRNHRSIERLANFTLRRGIAEIRRSRKRNGLMGTVITSPRTEFPPSSPPISGSLEQSFEVDDDAEAEKEPQAPMADASGGAIRPARPVPETPIRTGTDPLPATEKARGKMRRSSTSDDLGGQDGSLRNTLTAQEDEEDDLVNGFNDQELYLAASMIGREGFVPTQAWVTSWHKGLPLDVLQIAVVELVPKVQDLCSRIGSKSDADERVLAWLREQNLDGVLPPIAMTISGGMPQPRSFKWTTQVSIWLLSYVWGLIYLTSTLPYGLFNGSNARLFQLRLQDASGPNTPMTRSSTTAANRADGAGRPTRSSLSRETASSSMMRRSTSGTPLASPQFSAAYATLPGSGMTGMTGALDAVQAPQQRDPTAIGQATADRGGTV